MIIVLVKYVCKSNCRELFLNAIKEKKIDSLSRAETGNYRYEYAYSISDENTILLTELWEDRKAVTAHGQTEHYKELGKLKSAYVENTEIFRYEGSPIS